MDQSKEGPPSTLAEGASKPTINKPRARRNRLTDGCISCKNRRVKCDLARPGCWKCERSGRVCGGYEPHTSPREAEAQLQGLSRKNFNPSHVGLFDLPNVDATLNEAMSSLQTWPKSTTTIDDPYLTLKIDARCEGCKFRETDCSGTRPKCSECTWNGQECSYSEPTITKRRSNSSSITSKIISFESATLAEQIQPVPFSQTEHSTPSYPVSATPGYIYAKDKSPQSQITDPHATSTSNTYNDMPKIGYSLCYTTSSEDLTDWEDDSDTEGLFEFPYLSPNERIGTKPGVESSRTTDLLSFKSEIIDKLMTEFPTMFKRIWASKIQQCGSQTQPPNDSEKMTPTPQKSSKSIRNCEKRSHGEDSEIDESQDGRKRRRKRIQQDNNTACESSFNVEQFACPFRKHDPEKYCVQEWPRCSLKPQKTIARLKAHLYQYHLIQQCPRCKLVFDSEDALDAHSMSEERCEAELESHVDGMTRRMKDQIQSRRKTHPGQTEVDKWEQIYGILFPGEPIPEPYFEPILDLNIQQGQPPGFINLALYERYLRRVLPSIVRSALEVELNNELQPIEAQLRNRMMEIIQEAQNQAFMSFREARRAEPHQTYPSNSEDISPLRASADMIYTNESNDIVNTIFQPPTPAEVPRFHAEVEPEFLSHLREPNNLPSSSQLIEIAQPSSLSIIPGASTSITVSDYDWCDTLEGDSILTSSNPSNKDSGILPFDPTEMFQSLDHEYDSSWLDVTQDSQIGDN